MALPLTITELSVWTRAAANYPVRAELLPDGEITEGKYTIRFARTLAELDAAMRLRFEVFNLELGEGLEESFRTGRDRDEFDDTCHHLLVLERPPIKSSALTACARANWRKIMAAFIRRANLT